MGLLMPSLHEPTVKPQSGNEPMQNESKSLPDLINEKDRVEEELKALGSVLDSHSVNMNTSLTTFDGFPRADIDVAQIRTTRARIIRLRNDHKSLMSRIDAGLQSHFSTGSESGASASNPIANAASASTTSSHATAPSTNGRASGNPFAKVNSVEPRSPAAQAGLRVGDRVCSFGDADWLNHEKLGLVARIVGASERRPIPVTVLRNSETSVQWTQQQLTLTPRRGWGGRGLLGCHLVPE